MAREGEMLVARCIGDDKVLDWGGICCIETACSACHL